MSVVNFFLQKSRIFGRELCRVIPNSVSLYRNRSGVKKMVKSAGARGFTDIIIINENRREPGILYKTACLMDTPASEVSYTSAASWRRHLILIIKI